MSGNDPLQTTMHENIFFAWKCWRNSTAQNKHKWRFHSTAEPSFNLWLEMENSVEETLQNGKYAKLCQCCGVRAGERKSTRFSPLSQKKVKSKNYAKLFHFFFSLFRDLGRSNLINSRNNETSDYPWFIFFRLLFFRFSVCTAGVVNWKNVDICGWKNVKTIWKILCDLYANFSGGKVMNNFATVNFQAEFNYKRSQNPLHSVNF